jgi:hypothetical protein
VSDHPDIIRMITSQLNLQRALGFDVTHMTERQRVDYIRDNALNVIGEVMEALNEVNWKPWSSGTEIRQDACFAELRDAWQHLTNTMWAVYGETAYALAQRLEEKLEEKHDVNYRRLIEGYDGHSTVSPRAGRPGGSLCAGPRLLRPARRRAVTRDSGPSATVRLVG